MTSRGFEFDLRGELFTGLGVVLNYANTNVEDADGNKVVGFSKHITNGWFNYKFQERALEGFGVSLGYQYLVDRSTWAWGADGETDLPDYFRMDGAEAQSLILLFQIQASKSNRRPKRKCHKHQ